MFKNIKKPKLIVSFALLILLLAISGCGGEDSTQETKQPSTPSGAVELGKQEIELARANWDDQIASTYVVATVLEEMGYNVKQTVLDAGIMWQGIANGSADAMVGAWLPLTHGDYYNKTKDQLVDLGVNMEPTMNGWVVPTYVDIDSIEDLKDPEVREKFNGTIYGIEPGAGLMRVSKQAVEEYGLEDYELLESSGTAMVASLQKAIENEEWIVVTGWSPHWKFAKWDLKYLEDPKNILNGEETQYIATMAKQGLKEEAPAAYQMLDNFNWESKHMEKVMLNMNVNGMEPDAAAKEFIKNNKELVNSWLPDGYSI